LSQGKRPAKAPVLEPLLMERLALLGLHVANDKPLLTRLARALKFVADWHRPAADSAATPAAERTAAAAEISKVHGVSLTCSAPRES